METEIQLLSKTTATATASTPDIIDALNRLAFLQIENNLPESAQTIERALTKARNTNYRHGEAQALFNAGILASRQQQQEQALTHFQQALGIWKLLNDEKGTGNAYARMGNSNFHLGKYDRALECYHMALEIRTSSGDELGAAELFNNTGTIYGLQGSYTLALKSHLKALKTFEAIGNSTRIANSSSNIALIYKDQQNYDEALKMFKGAMVIY